MRTALIALTLGLVLALMGQLKLVKPPTPVPDIASAVKEKSTPPNESGFAMGTNTLGTPMHTDLVTLFWRDGDAGEWQSYTVRVVSIPNYLPTVCFKYVVKDTLADCFYVNKEGEVNLLNTLIIGEGDL